MKKNKQKKMKNIKTPKTHKKTSRPKFVMGIDEAGRGPLAGPVSISAVMISYDNYIKLKKEIGSSKWLLQSGLPPLKDSKKLTEGGREAWFKQIQKCKKCGLLDFSNSMISACEIDSVGISKAIKKGIEKILKKFQKIAPDQLNILLDGSLHAPLIYQNQKTIIKGDELETIISLASIISKVKRDRKMIEMDKKFTQYNFKKHKGYGTKEHLDLIKKYGLSEIHRKSFCKNISFKG